MVRCRGYATSIADIESVVVAASENGTPIRVKDIGQVSLGPHIRRGVSDLDGSGEAVSGIIVMRQGENALDVINRVKEKIRQIEPGLPPGVRMVPVYDRSELIHHSIDTLKSTVIEVIITVSLIVLPFLWHIPSALIPVITIAVCVRLLQRRPRPRPAQLRDRRRKLPVPFTLSN
jgi:Cu(I)/Ag(I) efflux system membrane protein CusA/SilA